MYVVAAVDQRPGPPALQPGRPWQTLVPTAQPVGTQHAVARTLRGGVPLLALCGEGVKGWVIFGGMPFAPGDSASCQRCAQLASSAAGHAEPA
jgi:hypothetical protein